MPSITEQLTRRKLLVPLDKSLLSRTLSTFDLTTLGIGATIGIGFYILTGSVARDTAGPAITISFLIAAVTSLFSGFCYAEFGARVPKAGSAYIYSYVCVGEFVAFIIGWNLILEYVIGSASVARGYSNYIDSLVNGSVSNAFESAMPLSASFLSPYPDFLAFGLCFVLTVESSNWSLSESEIYGNETCPHLNSTSEDYFGHGGFAPYGFAGIMKGAATCFFAFVGFDIIATTGEEALYPKKSIPIAIILSLSIVFLAYFGLSTILTMAIPYCQQDGNAPLIHFFDQLGMNGAKTVVGVGAVFGFSTSLLGSMFPMPRIIYSMADDGLLFKSLASVHSRFHTPVLATAISGLLAGFMALLFDLSALVDMMSIGTLLAYAMVALCVLVLRYSDAEVCCVPKDFSQVKYTQEGSMENINMSTKTILVEQSNKKISWTDLRRQLCNFDKLSEPTALTSYLVNILTVIFCFFAFLLGLLLTLLEESLKAVYSGSIFLVAVVAIVCIVVLVFIFLQPQSQHTLSFKAPFVPWFPAISAFSNFYLMCNLSPETWLRFLIWMIIGLFIYFFYGRLNSQEELGPLCGFTGYVNGTYLGDIPQINIFSATPVTSVHSTPNPEKKIPFPEEMRTEKMENLSKLADALIPVLEKENCGKVNEGFVEDIENSDAVNNNAEIVNTSEVCSSLYINEHPSDTFSGKLVNRADSICDTSKDLKTDCEGDVIQERHKSLGNQPKIFAGAESSGMQVSSKESAGYFEDLFSLVEELTSKTDTFGKQNFLSNNKIMNEIDGTTNEHTEGHVDSSHSMQEQSFMSESYNNDKEIKKLENNSIEISIKNIKGEFINSSDNDGLRREVKFFMHQDSSDSYQSISENADIKQDQFLSNLKEPFSNVNEQLKDYQHDNKMENMDKKKTVIPSMSLPHLVREREEKSGTSSSVPSSPVLKHHPNKVLRRMYSFDNIPPSSPDSPMARRVKQFIVIPITDSDVESTTSIVSGTDTPLDSIKNFQLESAFADLQSKLNQIKGEPALDSLPQEGIQDRPDEIPACLTGNMLGSEFKRVISKDVYDLELDTIRERGESKILYDDSRRGSRYED